LKIHQLIAGAKTVVTVVTVVTAVVVRPATIP
jgi:hypothetical protein